MKTITSFLALTLLLPQTLLFSDFEDSERKLKKALESEPANADHHFELANIYAQQHDVLLNAREKEAALEKQSAAARELEQAVMLNPDMIPARFNLGVVYKKQGKYAQARETFKRVLDQDPNQINALMQIGATYEEQGFYDEAESIYMEARDKNFSDPNIRYAIDDLQRRREIAENPQRAPISQMMPFRNGMPLAAAYQPTDPQQAISGGQAMQAMIPYLSSWLAQQFMKKKEAVS